MASHGRVFLRPANQVRDGFANGAVRNVFCDIVAFGGEVEADGVAHAEKLGEPNPFIRPRHAPFLHEHAKAFIARNIVAAVAHGDAVKAVDTPSEGGIEIAVRAGLVRLNGRRVATRCRPFAFLFHVGPSDKFHADVPALPSGHFRQAFEVGEAIAAVQLNRVEDHGPGAVVSPHLVDGELVDGRLQPRFLGIDEEAAVGFGSGGADSAHPQLDPFPCRQIVLALGRDSFEQMIWCHARDLEDVESHSVVVLGGADGAQDFGAALVEVPFAVLAFGAVVEDGVDVGCGKFGDSRFTMLDGFAAAEMGVNRRANGPTHRNAQAQGQVHQDLPDAHEARVSHGLEQNDCFAELGVGQVGKGLRSVVEIRNHFRRRMRRESTSGFAVLRAVALGHWPTNGTAGPRAGTSGKGRGV